MNGIIILDFISHNNKSLALTNTLTALQNNLKWIDATIKGMGTIINLKLK